MTGEAEHPTKPDLTGCCTSRYLEHNLCREHGGEDDIGVGQHLQKITGLLLARRLAVTAGGDWGLTTGQSPGS